MVTAAAALEEGLVDPDEPLDCEMGGITLAGVRISDHKAFGTLTFREVIAKSSNVGTIKTALRRREPRLLRRHPRLRLRPDLAASTCPARARAC